VEAGPENTWTLSESAKAPPTTAATATPHFVFRFGTPASSSVDVDGAPSPSTDIAGGGIDLAIENRTPLVLAMPVSTR
jgi:hypothetical protein